MQRSIRKRSSTGVSTGRRVLYGGILGYLMVGMFHIWVHNHFHLLVKTIFEAVILLGLPIGMISFLQWRSRDFSRDKDYWRVAIGGVAGTIITVSLFGLHVVDSRMSPAATMEGIIVADAGFTLLLAANWGAFAGLLFGWQEVRVRSRTRQVERAETEAELSSKHEQQLLFLNRILRHHVLNGLSVILKAIEELKEENHEDRHQSLKVIESRSERMAEHVADVRSVIKTLSGEIPCEPVELSAVLKEEVGFARDVFPEAEFELAASTDTPVIGSTHTSVIFEHLLENAVKHNDSDTPRVWVDVIEDGQSVRVSVADNGPGIPEKRKTAYFERGDYGEESLGEGLGLFLAETALSACDGDIWIEDNEPKGACVVLEFPKTDGGSVG